MPALFSSHYAKLIEFQSDIPEEGLSADYRSGDICLLNILVSQRLHPGEFLLSFASVRSITNSASYYQTSCGKLKQDFENRIIEFKSTSGYFVF